MPPKVSPNPRPALTIDQMFDIMDQLAEGTDERGEAILAALYDYVEQIAPAQA